MAVSRRHVLLQGCVIGAGVIAAHVPGMVALAQAQPPLRRSLGGMPLNDPILEAWRDGVRQLRARPASNPISWAASRLFTATPATSTGVRTATGTSCRGTGHICSCMSGWCGN